MNLPARYLPLILAPAFASATIGATFTWGTSSNRTVARNPTNSVHSAGGAVPSTNLVSESTDAALRAAVAIGGNVRICFDGTVLLTNTIIVSKDTTLDATGFSAGVSGGNAVRLFDVATNVTFSVTNLTFGSGRYVGTNGNDADASPDNRPQAGEDGAGGAIRNMGGVVSITSCLFSNNSVLGGNGGASNQFNVTNTPPGGAGRGGAIFNGAGTLAIYDSVFVGNSASGGEEGKHIMEYPNTNGFALGGAIASSGGDVFVLGSTFIENTCSNRALFLYQNRSVSGGGAIEMEEGSLYVSNCLFTGNASISQLIGNSSSAWVRGGALYLRSGAGTVFSCRIFNNCANAGYATNGAQPGTARGGAVYNSGEMSLWGSTISSNLSQGGGSGFLGAEASGGGIFNFGMLHLCDSTLSYNVARGGDGRGGAAAMGGAVDNAAVSFVTNCTFAENAAFGGNAARFDFAAGYARGGAISSRAGSLVLVNVTVATNRANIPAPVGTNALAFGSNLGFVNSDVTLRNCVLAANTNCVSGAITDDGYNVCSDGSAGFTNQTSFNFTDPKLMPLADNGGPTLTMALAPDSPAIDWAPAANAPATDQRGLARPYGMGADVGAFELGPALPSLTSFRTGAAVNVSFPGEAGLSYRIQRSPDLVTWETEENTGVLATNGVVSRSYPFTQPQRFYRLTLDF